MLLLTSAVKRIKFVYLSRGGSLTAPASIEKYRTKMPYWTDKEAMKMRTNQPQIKKLLNLEQSIRILETPFREVCDVLGLNHIQPSEFLEVDNCIFFFDPEREYVFSSAVIMGSSCGFYGIKTGANWLEAAGVLESQGFKQASDLERFTKPGRDFNISVYLYPDDNPDASASKVKDYSVCARYGQAL
jgi:hypothetical protein